MQSNAKIVTVVKAIVVVVEEQTISLHPELLAIGRLLVRILIGAQSTFPMHSLPSVARALAKLRSTGVSEEEIALFPDCIAFNGDAPRAFDQALARWLVEYSKSL